MSGRLAEFNIMMGFVILDTPPQKLGFTMVGSGLWRIL